MDQSPGDTLAKDSRDAIAQSPRDTIAKTHRDAIAQSLRETLAQSPRATSQCCLSSYAIFFS